MSQLLPELEILFSVIQTFPEARQNEIGRTLLTAIEEDSLPVIQFSDEEQTTIDAAFVGS